MSLQPRILFRICPRENNLPLFHLFWLLFVVRDPLKRTWCKIY